MGTGISTGLQLALVLVGGALLTAALAALVRWGLSAAVEPYARRFDPWRRRWFEPERELGSFLEALIILGFLGALAGRSALPAWGMGVVYALWVLRLPTDCWTWARLRRRPHRTLELHRRGFFLVDHGPLWLRFVVAAVAGGGYWTSPRLREALTAFFGLFLGALG